MQALKLDRKEGGRLAVLAIWGPLAILLPPFAGVYFINIGSFQAGLRDVFPIMLACCGALGLIIAATYILATKRHRATAAITWLAIGFVYWVSGTVFIWDFGPFQGDDFYVSDHLGKALVEVVAIGACLWVVITQRHWLVPRAGTIISIGAALSAVVLLPPFYFYVANADAASRAHVFTPDDLFALSRKQNVVMVLLDGFQSDIFYEIVQERDDIGSAFDGFTYYPDTVSTFSKTYLSIPGLLTEQRYDNSEKMFDFLRGVYLSETSIPYRLKQAGFDTRAVMAYQDPYRADPQVWSNTSPSADGLLEMEHRNLLMLALFRLHPIVLKPIAFDGGVIKYLYFMTRYDPVVVDWPGTCKPSFAPGTDSRVAKHFDFQVLGRLRDCLTLNDEAPAFRLYHLQGLHTPYYLTSDFQWVEGGVEDRAVIKEQGIGVLSMVAQVLAQFQESGAYDQSTIIIVSDHGLFEQEAGLNRKLFDQASPDSYDGPHQGIDEQIAAASSLMLIKPAGARGSMKLNLAPVASTDVPATIFDELELDTPASGKPINALGDAKPRRRDHYFYLFDGWQMQYVEELQHYEVNGPVWRRDSWSAPPTLVPPGDASRD